MTIIYTTIIYIYLKGAFTTMNERNSKMELLGSAPIPKALMALGVPIMIGMLINALYNLVDAYFVGGLGESPMGAISIVFPLGQVVVGLGLMFGNGAASYHSMSLGTIFLQARVQQKQLCALCF